MKPIKIITGPSGVLPCANVDTDQIIPARFMSRSRDDGYGEQCFHDLRFAPDGTARKDWPLRNFREGPTILVTYENFGCGSSREAAVYALMDYGVKAVIAPGFGDIFKSNAGKNGLLAIAISHENVQKIVDILAADPEIHVAIDLPSQHLQAGDLELNFEIDARLKYRLERGLDELSATLELENHIAEFETKHFKNKPWQRPVPSRMTS